MTRTIAKGDGGAVDLIEDEDKLRQWAVVAKIVRREGTSNFRHHKETLRFQKKFKEYYNNLISKFEKLGNPPFVTVMKMT